MKKMPFAKAYNSFKKQGDLEAINKTREYIDEYYIKNEITSTDLLKRYSTVQFNHNQLFPILCSIIFGVISGVALSVFTDSPTNSNEKISIITNFFTSIITYIFLFCMIVWSIFKVRKFYSNSYDIYIEPYELEVIKNKLFNEYDFDVNGINKNHITKVVVKRKKHKN